MNYERVPLAERFPKMESGGVFDVYGEIPISVGQGLNSNLNVWNPKSNENGMSCARKGQRAPTFIQIPNG
jgi:hypothetical protein